MAVNFKIVRFLCLLAWCFFSRAAFCQHDTSGIVFHDIKSSSQIAKQNSAQLSPITQKPLSVQQKEHGWLLLLSGFLGGLAALLMPCIFPMLPLTVGYFTKRHQNRTQGIRDALLYGLSIIMIYVGLGIAVTIVFGASALNNLATNGIFNFSFFLLLVVFAASFLGGFEITLPNYWINKAEENTGKKGFTGILMMAAVLALVSFSCTGPIIGTLLVQAATNGERLGPAIGMLGFSMALALPFILFALFPSWLHNLPKSGGWMQAIKISLGFLELGLSLKFLSNVDLAYHWHWFDREVFLVLWIMICGCFALYLLGKLRLHGETTIEIGVPRLFTGIIIGAFCLYMVPGLWGAPLKSIAAFLPPQSTQDFDLYTPTLTNTPSAGREAIDWHNIKYASLFQAPLSLHAFFDYEDGMAYAKSVHKPVLIDFTGHACVNCRKMEATIWPDRKVLSFIRDDYVLIQLYVDDKTAVAHSTIGEINSKLQAEKFNSNSQPDYVLLNPDTGQQLVPPQGAVYDSGQYAAFLQSGLQQFR
jgi:thiol:disulfide interchange protein